VTSGFFKHANLYWALIQKVLLRSPLFLVIGAHKARHPLLKGTGTLTNTNYYAGESCIRYCNTGNMNVQIFI